MTATTATMDTRSYTSSSTTTTGAGRNDFGMPGKKIEEVCVARKVEGPSQYPLIVANILDAV